LLSLDFKFESKIYVYVMRNFSQFKIRERFDFQSINFEILFEIYFKKHVRNTLLNIIYRLMFEKIHYKMKSLIFKDIK